MKIFIWIVLVLIIVGGAWWYFSMPATTTPTPTPDVIAPNPATTTDTATTTGTTTTTATPGAAMSATVMYGAQGFSPSSVTIAKGGTVKWVSQSGSSMWVASDQHPSHTVYAGTTRQAHCPDASGTAFDQCSPGTEYSFTFNKAGSWKYHDHMNAIQGGTVIVQ